MNKNIFHVLVVDDDDRIRELVKQFLEENNFLVTSAKDALDAKKKLEIVKFDILILDIMMPGESGLSLTKEIKKKNSTPIILLTAKGEAQDRIKGLELGADDYLGKPFEPKELLLRIKNILYKIQKPILLDEVYIGNTIVNLKKLDEKLIKKAAKALEGKHDFTSFRSTNCQAKSPIKTINSIKIIRKSSEIEIWIKAKSFLHNQVRIIAGTLMMVGKAKWKKKDVENALKAKKRGAAGQTAPAYGLFLFSVKY